MQLENSFIGTTNLYGEEGAGKIFNAHVCIIGLGGVGSWAAESIVRHGVKNITLIDLDHIVDSNINRQIQALSVNIGQSKIKAMSNRLLSINPKCHVNLIDDFLTLENISHLITDQFNVVIDAIDESKVKLELINFCYRNKINLVTSGGAGGKLDPTKIMVADIFESYGDPLLSKIRSRLKKIFIGKKKLKIPTVFSPEAITKPKDCASQLQGLSCAGYGSSVSVTAAFGFFAAAEAFKIITK
jgi:tRNA A37 threonylcarbamoyladenosine dehydratase